MKKVLMIAAASAFLASGLAATEVSAKSYVEAKCSACHNATKDKTGPSWAKVQAAYGSADALAAAFASGFKVEDRKVAAGDEAWHKKAKMMSAQYKKLISKQDPADIAAQVFSMK